MKKRSCQSTYYHIITADGIANLKNSLIPLNASLENDMRVSLQESENLMYTTRINTLIQYEMLIESAAPTFWSLVLNTMAQHKGMWMQRVAIELRSMGRIKLWDWRNFMRGCTMPYAKRAGIIHTMYLPASWEIRGSWPMRERSFPMEIHNREIGRLTSMSERMALYVWIPSFLYSFAPYAWPQRVSNPLAIPTCQLGRIIID